MDDQLKPLQSLVISSLEDIKARDIEVIDTTKISALFDCMVIASADSSRQTRALANHVREKVLERFPVTVRIEGEDSGEWILVDLGSIIVHIMQPAVRSYYRLEDLWSTKSVADLTAKKSHNEVK